MTAPEISNMGICRVGIALRLIYHDGRDWIIERRGEDYWSFPLDGDEWQPGFPAGLTEQDVGWMFEE
jgi:hypothetical protein